MRWQDTASDAVGFSRVQRGASGVNRVKPAALRSKLLGLAGLPMLLIVAPLVIAAPLAGCGAQIDRHGHVFTDVDVGQVQAGMSKDQVKATLGSPDTTGTINGEAYYYIATTQKSYAFFKPWEIDRQVMAVYFDNHQTVQQVAHYGLKDGIVVNYAKDETPARGKDLSFIEQLFGGISQRKLFKDQRAQGSGIPGANP
jgi:outer membrane protein assembly factor BamE (lipoprotein component of BamABCDE complex)